MDSFVRLHYDSYLDNLQDSVDVYYTCSECGKECLPVVEDCNIRTDKWALAMDAMDKVNNYKLNEYLKKGEAETSKTAEGETEGGVTETNPTRDN